MKRRRTKKMRKNLLNLVNTYMQNISRSKSFGRLVLIVAMKQKGKVIKQNPETMPSLIKVF